jgi:hypothetical protein
MFLILNSKTMSLRRQLARHAIRQMNWSSVTPGGCASNTISGGMFCQVAVSSVVSGNCTESLLIRYVRTTNSLIEEGANMKNIKILIDLNDKYILHEAECSEAKYWIVQTCTEGCEHLHRMEEYYARKANTNSTTPPAST